MSASRPRPMTKSDAKPLVIWAVSDGLIGNANQVLGLAEAIAHERKAEIVVKTLGWKGRNRARLPWYLNPLPRTGLSDPDQIAPPWPDIWLSVGRRTLPFAM